MIIAGAFVGGILFQGNNSSKNIPTITSDLIANEIKSISEYAFLEYRYTNVGKFENRVDFYGWKVPFTTKSFIITYDGSMKLGILGKDIDIQLKENEIHIKLPNPQILSHEIYEDTLEILDQSKNIFNQIQIEDYTTFASEQKKEMEEKANSSGLFLETSENAKIQIEKLVGGILSLNGDNYKIVFIEE